MLSTLITLDISTEGVLKKDFVGSAFRGWLGCILKCNNNNKDCITCEESNDCPYYMVFKEKSGSGIRPYSILAFKNNDSISGFIRVHGDKRKLVPKILSDIQNRSGATHFGGHRYNVRSIKVKNVDIRPVAVSNKMRLVTTSPLSIMRNGQIEMLPSLNTIIHSCVRTYNRISKYHDPSNYPYHVSEDVMDFNADILDFDVKTVEYEHTSMNDMKISLKGIEGWITYDTSCLLKEVPKILGMGEALQIGKHTTYGFGGFLMLSQED